MTNKNVKPQVNGNVISPVVAAVAGAVAGAMIMSDKKNQDKVKKLISNVKDNLNQKKESIVKKVNKIEDITKNTVNEVKNI